MAPPQHADILYSMGAKIGNTGWFGAEGGILENPSEPQCLSRFFSYLQQLIYHERLRVSMREHLASTALVPRGEIRLLLPAEP
jgi:hypothetical protein